MNPDHFTSRSHVSGAFAAAVLFVLTCADCGYSSEGQAGVAVTNVTAIDVLSGEHLNGVTVLVLGDRIAEVGRTVQIPDGARSIDGSGKYLIPGLWDMHVHYQFVGADAADLFVALGVVGTRDMGADLDFILPLRDRIRSGEILAPDLIFSGPILDDAPPSFPFRLRVMNQDDARKAVRMLKDRGVDFVKVHDHTPRDSFFAIVDEARRMELPVAGHVPLGVTVGEAAASGMQSIEHLANYREFDECTPGDTYVTAACDPLYEKLTAAGVWQTPTMVFFQSVPDVFSGKPMEHTEYASDLLLASTRHNVGSSNLDAKTLDALRNAGRISLEAVRDLHAHGSRFLAGCDALVPGFCLHDELAWLTKAGFTPLEALQTATINPARFLHREATQGSIEAGKRADLVLLSSDPLQEIRNTTKIETVILRGKVVEKSEIERIVSSHRRSDGASAAK